MKQKEITKPFMMISDLKIPLYKNNSALQVLKYHLFTADLLVPFAHIPWLSQVKDNNYSRLLSSLL